MLISLETADWPEAGPTTLVALLKYLENSTTSSLPPPLQASLAAALPAMAGAAGRMHAAAVEASAGAAGAAGGEQEAEGGGAAAAAAAAGPGGPQQLEEAAREYIGASVQLLHFLANQGAGGPAGSATTAAASNTAGGRQGAAATAPSPAAGGQLSVAQLTQALGPLTSALAEGWMESQHHPSFLYALTRLAPLLQSAGPIAVASASSGSAAAGPAAPGATASQPSGAEQQQEQGQEQGKKPRPGWLVGAAGPALASLLPVALAATGPALPRYSHVELVTVFTSLTALGAPLGSDWLERFWEYSRAQVGSNFLG